jgi:carotenoid cleavage dioxygenase-like enzyme
MADATTTVRPIDIADEPFLSGRFAPITTEVVGDDLAVIGRIPTDLNGAYLRNGPNPEFTPLGSYMYPLEGDGMIHGVWLEDGHARYANRFVKSQGLLAEERAGHALFGGLMTPILVDMSLLGDDPDPTWPFKLNPFINVVRHAGRMLALAEGDQPYEITPDLDTVGRYDFGSSLPGICAHPKIDPITGEMIVFRYDIAEPYLTWATVGSDGTVTQPPVAVDDIDASYMIHDFAITERFIVLIVGPLLLDVAAFGGEGAPLNWDIEKGTRIAIIPRDRATPTRWVHGDAFWAWHYANAFEDGDVIHLDLPYSTSPGLVLPPEQRPAPRFGFTRATLHPSVGTFELNHLDDIGCEFPRIDDRLVGRRHRYLTAAGRSSNTALAAGEHDVLRQYDMDAGTSTEFRSSAALGEVAFAPRVGSAGELDGYYVAFGTEFDSGQSAMYIWDAAEFPADPVAVITVPQRIPNGLHGNWFPTES